MTRQTPKRSKTQLCANVHASDRLVPPCWTRVTAMLPTYLFFSVERVEVVVIRQLYSTSDVFQSKQTNTIHSINRPERERHRDFFNIDLLANTWNPCNANPLCLCFNILKCHWVKSLDWSWLNMKQPHWVLHFCRMRHIFRHRCGCICVRSKS